MKTFFKNPANPLTLLLMVQTIFASANADYSAALQTHFAKGTLGESGKTRPIEMFFQNVFKSGNIYSVSGKSKTNAAEDVFAGTLSISSVTPGASCNSGETEIKGSYDLNEKESKTSGSFKGSFTACEKNGKLSKASFKGDWVKHATGGKTPCSFELGFSIKEMYPKFGREFNEKDAVEYSKIVEALRKVEWDESKLTAKQRELAEKLGVSETMDSYWDAVGAGCSWYCGGGPNSISASSYLKSSNAKINYLPENIHDLNFETAWVEGVKGHGIGEYVTYSFSQNSPRITTILIANGYVKSEKAFRENSRVKKLKMYIDGKPVAILNLEDIRREQIFEFEPMGRYSGPQWTLKFEILEVYPGDKFEDTAISEIYFDGLDVHCFAAGTKILMKDNSLKNIELIQKGDWVKSYDFKNKKLIDSKVTKLISATHSDLLKLKFAGNEIIATADHPFWIEKGVWAGAGKLKIGDKVFMPEKNVFMEIIGVEAIDAQQITYTIELSRGDNFIANGMLVKVETLKQYDSPH